MHRVLLECCMLVRVHTVRSVVACMVRVGISWARLSARRR